MKRKPLAILPRWILLSSVLVSSVTFVPCYSTTLASHTLRHRQRGPSGLPRPSRDDGGEPLESSSRPNGTFTSYSSSSSVTSSPSPVPPSSLPPREVTVSQHEEARLTCDLPADYSRGGDDGGSAPPRFEPVWRHGEEVVDAVKVSGSMLGRVGSLGHRFTRDSITGQLNIANVRLDDDGLWRCEDREPVTGALLATSAPIRLVVLEPPRAPYLSVDGRRLDPGNVFVPVKEGAELSLWCTVDGGHPAPTLSWLLDTAALDATRLDAPAQRHWRAEARLGPVLRDHHNATVTCLVSHVTLAAPLNVSLLLDVQYSPSFMISRIPGFGFPITEGIPVSLKCDVDSNPPSSPVWAKDDGPPPVAQSGDGFLNFSSIRRDHSGWYKCTCRHPLGEFSSIGYFLNIRYEEEGGVTQGPGDNWATDHQVEVALGGAVQLQCPPGSVSCWSRVGPGGLLEPVGPGPELGLDRVLYQEAGEYRCVVGGGRPELDQWRVGGSVDLVVTGVPEVFPLNKTLTSLTGQQLALTVEFCANPAASHVVWLTPSKAMLPGDFSGLLWAQPLTAGSSPHCQQAALMMRVVTLDDEGEYVFVVRSPRGLAEGTITLNVTHASSFSVPAARAYHMSAALSLLVVALTLPQFYIKQTICV